MRKDYMKTSVVQKTFGLNVKIGKIGKIGNAIMAVIFTIFTFF